MPYLVHGRWADSTQQKYEKAWEKWELWCALYPESPTLPANPFYVALYINDLVLGECKIGALEAAAAGIRYGHIVADLRNPMQDMFVKTVLDRIGIFCSYDLS